MSWSIFWTCPGRSATELLTTSDTPTTVLRSERKTSGLFDESGTGVTDGKVASADYSLAQHCTDLVSSDLLSSTDILSSFPDSGPMPQIPDLGVAGVSGTPGVDALEANFGNEDPGFCEVFTDLTDFLLESVGSMDAPSKGGSTRKRTATEALLDAMENDTPAAPTSPVVDHNDYTMKPQKKRARTSTVTSESASMSEAESTVSCVSASTSASVSTIDRQIERRVKNNIASRRSRQTRKQKFADLEEEAVRLQKQNKELTATVADLQAKVKKMKDELIARLARK